MNTIIEANSIHLDGIRQLLIARNPIAYEASFSAVQESINIGLCWVVLDEDQNVVGICNGVYDKLSATNKNIKIFYWMNLFILETARNLFLFLQLKKMMKNKLIKDNCDIILAFVHRPFICKLHEKTGMKLVSRRYLKITIPILQFWQNIGTYSLNAVYNLKNSNFNEFWIHKNLRLIYYKKLPIFCIQRINAGVPYLLKLVPMLFLSNTQSGVVIKTYNIFVEVLNSEIDPAICTDLIIECGDHDAL